MHSLSLSMKHTESETLCILIVYHVVSNYVFEHLRSEFSKEIKIAKTDIITLGECTSIYTTIKGTHDHNAQGVMHHDDMQGTLPDTEQVLYRGSESDGIKS